MNQKRHSKARCHPGAAIITLALLVGMCGAYILMSTQLAVQDTPKHSRLEQREITVGDAMLLVEVAETPEEREAGLSNYESLAEGAGMLFVFDYEERHAFWMKDMNFPIDIVWINADKEVAHITEHLTPDTYPELFTPPTPVRYVLEVPAGYARERITIGDTMTIGNVLMYME